MWSWSRDSRASRSAARRRLLGDVLDNADQAHDLALFRDRIAPDPNPAHGPIGPQDAALRINMARLIHGGVLTLHHFLVQGVDAFHVGVGLSMKALTGAAPHLLVSRG